MQGFVKASSLGDFSHERSKDQVILVGRRSPLEMDASCTQLCLSRLLLLATDHRKKIRSLLLQNLLPRLLRAVLCV